jgi:hypothetical protein
MILKRKKLDSTPIIYLFNRRISKEIREHIDENIDVVALRFLRYKISLVVDEEVFKQLHISFGWE